jgi:enoyl-CoA hydratase/carnithine racemase
MVMPRRGLGLVSRWCPQEFRRRPAGFTRANAPVRRAVARAAPRAGADEAMALEVDATADCLASEDLREGTRAFHERREPRYVGR